MNIGITGSFDRLVIMDRIVLSRFLIGSRTLHDGLGGVCRPFLVRPDLTVSDRALAQTI
jgi:hypothetical protein